MNEMISVTTNGSWVTMIVKISAGSSGARRAQFADRRSALSAVRPPPRAVPGSPVSVALMTPPPVSRRWCRNGAAPSRLPGPIALCDVVGELLAAIERIVDRGPSGDHRADLERHLRAEVGELRYVDELDARGRPRLDPRVQRVGALDRRTGGLGERGRLGDV